MSTRVALVTGGIGELGRSICERLTRQGCRVAALVAFLCTDESAFITGANYSINGGHHMH